MSDNRNKAGLDPRYLLIALLPALVFILNKWVITTYAMPYDVPPLRLAEFDVDREAAGRIGMLATFMLFTGAALAALLFFAYTLRMFDWRGRAMPFLAFLGMAFSAQLVAGYGGSRDAHEYAGRSLACLAASYNKGDSDSAREAEARAIAAAPRPKAQENGVAVASLPYGRPCQNDQFEQIRRLGAWQFLGVTFSFAGLVIGAICCLATWPGTAPTSGQEAARVAGELQHWETQSEWLNTYLYLAALLLGTALVFINAFLRWPAYVMLDPARYYEHSAALVSFYGVVFTIMLASFYIPVATILAGKVKALKPAAPGESKLPDAFKGPLQILKIVLGLFSTALAGALPGIIDLIS